MNSTAHRSNVTVELPGLTRAEVRALIELLGGTTATVTLHRVPMTQEEFLHHNGLACPICRKFEYSNIRRVGASTTAFTCDVCGSIWWRKQATVGYKLIFHEKGEGRLGD